MFSVAIPDIHISQCDAKTNIIIKLSKINSSGRDRTFIIHDDVKYIVHDEDGQTGSVGTCNIHDEKVQTGRENFSNL